MRRNVAILITVFAAIFAGIVVYDHAIKPAYDSIMGDGGSDNPGGADNKISTNGIGYPIADILTYNSQSYLENAYPAPAGYEWVANSDKGSGFAQQSWYENVWAKAQNIKTNTDEGVKYNGYFIGAMNNQKVAYLREFDANDLSKDYGNGRKLIIVFRNADGDLKVKKLPRSIDNFDLESDINDVTEVFKAKPVAEVSATQTVVDVLAKYGIISPKTENTTASAESKVVEKTKYVLANGTIVDSLPSTPAPAQKEYVLINAATGNTVGQQVAEPAPAAQTSKVTPYKSARSGSSGTSSSSGTSGSTSSSKKSSVTPYKSART